MNRDAFVTTQRPWIAARVEPAGPLTFDMNGLNVNAKFTLANTGNSPAVNVNIYPRVTAPAIGIDKFFDVAEALQETIRQRRAGPPSPWGSTIHPNETHTEHMKIVSIDKNELARITQQFKGIYPVLLVIVEYRFVFDVGPHFTAFAMDIRRAGATPSSVDPDRSRLILFVDEGDVPANNLLFVSSPIAGEYAD